MDQNNLVALWPQSPYKKWQLKLSHVKYWGAVLAFFMMIGAIRVFLNYATLQANIEHVIDERENIIRQEQYSALQAYVYSLPISETFIAHDNGILLQGERIMLRMKPEEIAIVQPPQDQAALSWQVWTWAQWTGGNLVGSWWNNWKSSDEQKDFLESLPSWKSWVVYFGQKMDANNNSNTTNNTMSGSWDMQWQSE